VTAGPLRVVKWYTRALRFPKLIGKFGLDNRTIPGGPYKRSQILAGIAVFSVMQVTRPLWSGRGTVADVVLQFGLSIGAGFIVGYLPRTTRNPLLIVFGTARAAAAPVWGRRDGRQLSIRRPHRVRGVVLVDTRPIDPPPPAEPDDATSAGGAAGDADSRALSGVQAVLADAPIRRDSPRSEALEVAR
jgi:hypothetical protein